MKILSGKFTFAAFLLITFTNIFGQTTFSVTNTNNDGDGSLAEAINDANNNSGSDIIEFNIPGDGPHTIQLTSALPDIDDPVVIEGYSEPGAQKATESSIAILMIELEGTDAGDDVFGLIIIADDCIIEGLAITNFGQGGIYIGGNDNIIRGNHIGVSLDGTEPKGNGFRSSDESLYDGIWIDGSENLIGGLLVGDRNVISCNGFSNIYIEGSATNNNTIQGNFIGPDATGTALLDNQTDGIYSLTGSGNLIGGIESGARNLISGNDYSGIYFNSEDGPSIIKGNFIGTDISGTSELGNGSVGIGIVAGSNYIVGGTDQGASNLISGNGYIDETGGLGLIEVSNENKVEGNLFGTDINGTSSIPNYLYGILINESQGNYIGGSEQNSGNLISGNELLGILITNSQENEIKGNIIGLDKTGTKELGNLESGIDIYSSSSNIIGGDSPEDKNTISGNGFEGIIIGTPDSKSNKIMGNNIGVGIDGTTILGNAYNGIGIYAGSDNIIGGILSGEGNIIAGNGENGVFIKEESSVQALNKISLLKKRNSISAIRIQKRHKGQKSSASKDFSFTKISSNLNKTSIVASDSGYSNSILGNSIFANENLGIDLSSITRTNDENDSDVGPNSGQNFPELESATLIGTNASLSYLVNSSITNSLYPLRIEFFISDSTGQGKVFIGTDLYSSAEAKNIKTMNFTTDIIIDTSMLIVATATDTMGNTSEFSEPVEASVVVGIDIISKLPNGYTLSQNYPNPFNPTTTIRYTVPDIGANLSQQVSLKIYDILGNEVVTLVNEEHSAGNYTLNFNASNLSSGIYYYTLKSENFSLTKKMIFLK